MRGFEWMPGFLHLRLLSKWSYADADEKWISEKSCRKKRVISNHAMVGIYYYKRAWEISTNLQTQ
jgi:hypothetical protein